MKMNVKGKKKFENYLKKEEEKETWCVLLLMSCVLLIIGLLPFCLLHFGYSIHQHSSPPSSSFCVQVEYHYTRER